ncbi:cytochrome b [Legionella spiritensis]|uniref:cytochrome b n=1 Tax=Legionella spiritensis TaxID=452 RepID=UPI000F842A4C|nr:cytochrome b [Legionella spiritensis]
MKKKVESYSAGSKFLHWIIALIVITMLSVSFFLDDLPDSLQGVAFTIHKSLGVTVLVLVLLRLVWLMAFGRPSLPLAMPGWQKKMAHGVQYSLYVFLLLMPICGWIMSTAANRAPMYFGMFSLPIPLVPVNKQLAGFMKECHETIAWILIALIVLHVAGALKHHFIDKDNVLRRMLWEKKKG